MSKLKNSKWKGSTLKIEKAKEDYQVRFDREKNELEKAKNEVVKVAKTKIVEIPPKHNERRKRVVISNSSKNHLN